MLMMIMMMVVAMNCADADVHVAVDRLDELG